MNPYAPPPLDFSDGIKRHATWSPYDNNGGTCIAIAGKGYCIAACSTRLNKDLSVLTRKHTTLLKVNKHCTVVASGFQADIKAVQKSLQAQHVMYEHQNNKPMSCVAVARQLSNSMYFRRMFPYYTLTICAGLDENGDGLVYNYDAIGSSEASTHSSQGSGQSLVMPLLDNQVPKQSPLVFPQKPLTEELSLEEALELLKTCFTSATERDIYTADGAEIVIMTKEGMRTEFLELKND